MRTRTDHDEPTNELQTDTTVTGAAASTLARPATDATVVTTTAAAPVADVPVSTHDRDRDGAAAVLRPGGLPVDPGVPSAPGAGRQSDAPWVAVAILAVVTLVVGSVVWLSGSSGESSSSTPGVAQAGVATAIDPADALQRLAERGYAPRAAIDRDEAITSQLVRQGLVPGGRFDDAVLRDLQSRGLVPRGDTAVDADVLQRLVARGLVPSGRFDDPALLDLQSHGLVPATGSDG